MQQANPATQHHRPPGPLNMCNPLDFKLMVVHKRMTLQLPQGAHLPVIAHAIRHPQQRQHVEGHGEGVCHPHAALHRLIFRLSPFYSLPGFHQLSVDPHGWTTVYAHCSIVRGNVQAE